MFDEEPKYVIHAQTREGAEMDLGVAKMFFYGFILGGLCWMVSGIVGIFEFFFPGSKIWATWGVPITASLFFLGLLAIVAWFLCKGLFRPKTRR